MDDFSQTKVIIRKVKPKYLGQECPVCRGFGTLKYGAKVCQACEGKGYILVPAEEINDKEITSKS